MRLRRLHAKIAWICNVATLTLHSQSDDLLLYRMPRALQDVYASNLLRAQNFGYPLGDPRPKYESDLEGLQVGDVGYVDDYGEFNSAFNISSPPKELQGKIPGFHFSYPISTPAFPSGTVFMAGVKRIPDYPRYRHTTVDIPQFLHSSVPSADYAFKMTSSEGAILVLPDGAVLSELCEDEELEKLREHVAKYTLEICRWVKRGTLFLVTGVFKSKSWTLGSFYGGYRGAEIVVYRRSSRDTGTFMHYWEYETNVHAKQGPPDNNYYNQTVLISAFKLTSRNGWLPVVERVAQSMQSFPYVLAKMTSSLLRNYLVTRSGTPVPML